VKATKGQVGRAVMWWSSQANSKACEVRLCDRVGLETMSDADERRDAESRMITSVTDPA